MESESTTTKVDLFHPEAEAIARMIPSTLTWSPSNTEFWEVVDREWLWKRECQEEYLPFKPGPWAVLNPPENLAVKRIVGIRGHEPLNGKRNDCL